MDTHWLSYDELARALRITPDSARRLAGRNKHWPRKPGNDGRTRVGVPAERLPPDNPTDVGTDAGPVIGTDAGADIGTDAGAVIGADTRRTLDALEQHVGTLKEALARAEARADRLDGDLAGARRDLDEERARSALLQADAACVGTLRDTVAALKGALETEKGRAGELRAERDRLAARRSWLPWRRAG